MIKRKRGTKSDVTAKKCGLIQPTVPGASQVIIYKMKAKKHFRRTNGHRQPLTKILVTKITQ